MGLLTATGMTGARFPRSPSTCVHRRADYESDMDDLSALGKLVLWSGLGLAVLGIVLIVVGKGLLPHLPGDLSFKVGNVRVFLPLATSILLSIVLTVLLNVFLRR